MKTRLLCSAAVFFLIISPEVRAETCTWIGGDDTWTTPTGWTCGHVPTDADTAVINSGSVVTLDLDATILGFTLQNTSTLTGNGDLSITGAMTWESGGSMEGTGETILADMTVLDATDGMLLTLNRTLRSSGTITCGASIQGSGQIVNAAGATFNAGDVEECLIHVGVENQEGGTFLVVAGFTSRLFAAMSSTGIIDVRSHLHVNGSLTSTGPIEMVNGTVFINSGGLVSVDDTLSMSGAGSHVLVSGGELIVLSTGIIDATTDNFQGRLTINPGSVLVEAGGRLMADRLTISGSVPPGVLILEAGAEVVPGTFDCIISGRLQGEGTLIGNMLNNDAGCTVAPGTSPGIFTIQGNYTNPTLEIEVGGLAPGTEHDQLAVSGDAMLEGTLRVLLTEGYTPTIGDIYTVLTAASITGTFDTIELPDRIEAAIDIQSDHVDVIVTNVTVGNEPVATPTDFTLDPIYPNPFSSSASLSFVLEQPKHIRVSLFDMLGREVQVLVDNLYPSGQHEIELVGQNLSSGMYNVRFVADEFAQTRRITLLR